MGNGRIRRKTKFGLFLYFGILLFIIVFTVLVWKSTAFSDAYLNNVFPIWVNTYGRFTGLFRFSVGEWMIVAGVILVGLALVLFPVSLIAGAMNLSQKRKAKRTEAVRHLVGFCSRFYLFFAWVLLIVCLIMTLNCVVLYHGSTFAQTYFSEKKDAYNTDNLVALWNRVASNCNRLADEVYRDDKGVIVFKSSLNKEGHIIDMRERAIENMQQLGERYPRLAGFYPRPKPMFFSDFMCQQYMEGYYFPFSLEANYNDVMFVMNKPGSMCHELAHLKGYLLEDEANFIGYLACVESDDPYFQYSGYMGVLYYVQKELNFAAKNDPEFKNKGYEIIQLDPRVMEDNVFVTDEEWERIEKKAFWDTETVDAVSDTFVDTTLKVNGVSDGMHSYNRVVQLLLCYYD